MAFPSLGRSELCRSGRILPVGRAADGARHARICAGRRASSRRRRLMLCAHSTAPLLYRRGKSHTCAPRWRPRWAASVTAPPRLHRPPSAGPCLPAWRSTPRRCCATCASTCPGSRASAFRSRCAAKASLTRSCARSCEAIDVYQFKHGQSNPTYCVIASVSVCGGRRARFSVWQPALTRGVLHAGASPVRGPQEATGPASAISASRGARV